MTGGSLGAASMTVRPRTTWASAGASREVAVSKRKRMGASRVTSESATPIPAPSVTV
jgi:hypothetical protein